MPALQLKSTKEKLAALTLAVAVGIGFVAWNFVVKPQSLKRAAIVGEQGSDRAKKDLLSAISAKEKALAAYRPRFPDKTEPSWLIETLNEIADEAGVSIVSVAPIGRESLDAYVRMPVRLEIDCSYYSLGDFVSRIENHERFLKVNAMRVDGNRSPEQASQSLRVAMTVSALYPVGDVLQ